METVGVVPAAGKASRVGPLPCSKEIFPVGFHGPGEGLTGRPKVACQYLLEAMGLAGVSKAFVVLREGKWDVAAYLKGGTSLGMNLAYLVMPFSHGVPHTLDQAYPFLGESRVILGFPDTIIYPQNAFLRLLSHQDKHRSDLVLGLFPAQDPTKVDMVDLGKDGRVETIKIKPVSTHLRYTWLIGAWTPAFTEFMHGYMLRLARSAGATDQMEEVHLSRVIQEAVDSRMKVDAVRFDDGTYFDIGTPEDMLKAVRQAVGVFTASIE